MPTIDKNRTALLIMDFQNDIVDPKGLFGSQGIAAQIAEKQAIVNTAKAMAAARTAGVRVVHVAVRFRPGHPEVVGDAALFTAIKDGNILVEGTWGAAFHPDVAPVEDELVVTKRGVSALIGTDLDAILRATGIDTLVLTGIVTNFVVDGTARDAVDHGYRVTILTDCCATFTGEMHRSSLDVLTRLASMSSADEFAAAL